MQSTNRFHAITFLALAAFTAPVAAMTTIAADAKTKLSLKRAEFEQVVISPNGQLLAFARRVEAGTIVSINRVDDLSVIRSIDPGKNGEIDTLRWLDDDRLIVGANRADSLFGMPMVDPTLFIVPVAASGEVIKLPANFVATIDNDSEHLLVSRCSHWVDGDCVLEIRKATVDHLVRAGELMIAAPDSHSVMMPDRQGRVRFAIGYAKDGTSKTWVLGDDGKAWTQINDEAVTGLTVLPMGVTADGKSGILQSESVAGTDVVQRYEFATGKRTELMHDAASDPLGLIKATDSREPIGAFFGSTHLQMHFWNPDHPQAKLLTELQTVFPGRTVVLTSASVDGKRVVLEVASDRDPGSYYLLDRNTNKARLLTRSHPWLEPTAQASSREFSVTARDGLVLHGLLTIPAGATEHKLPMVVLPHGGPYGLADGWGYDPELQILAQQGFAVLQVNFRGSGGVGKDFVNKGMRQWGKAMQDDVTDATRWAIDQGIADPARLCIYGASYGAYAAMMGAIREPDLYRCAAGYAGVYDLNKMYKWDSLRRSDLGLEFLHRALGTDAADLSANSPAQQAGRIKANVFLAHGRLDGIADFRFARAMEKAINHAKGQKVDLIEYPYQGHGLMLAEQREDFYARLLEFLHANLDAPEATAVAGAH